MALAIAGFVVVRNFSKVVPETLPPALRPVPPDTALAAFRASIRRKVMNLSDRVASRRKQFGDRMTPVQDSLGRECDSAIALVRSRIAELDTASREQRKAMADSAKAEYERAKLKVRAFTRSASQSDLIDEDSLDREIKKLISE